MKGRVGLVTGPFTSQTTKAYNSRFDSNVPLCRRCGEWFVELR